MPLVIDQQRADAAPQQPPEGAMSFSEFIRSRSNDTELRMIRVLIDHLLQLEDRTVQARENMYRNMRHGRIDMSEGFHNMLRDSRDTSSLRVGFLVGFATSVGMESEILTKMQATFGGPPNPATHPGGAAEANGVNDVVSSDHEMVEASESSGTTEESGTDEDDEDVEANDSEDANSTGITSTAVAINGNGETNGYALTNGINGAYVNGGANTTRT